MAKQSTPQELDFVRWFRNASGYINAFRGRTFVITFGGEMLADAQFASLVHDLALLNSLGINLVLVHGARPQIEQRLKDRNATIAYVNGLRVTDDVALNCVKEASSSVRADIEALLSMGLANTPMHGSRIRVVSGNFVTAQPLGVRDGVDYLHTGEVRRIDHGAIEQQLKMGNIVLLSPIGYSPTGEIFNLTAEDVATAAAKQLEASKIIYLVDGKGVTDKRNKLLRELNLEQAQKLLAANKLDESMRRTLSSAMKACSGDVERAHILNRHVDGGLILELFTRDGCGTLVTAEDYEDLRPATIEDIGGLLELIAPFENDGTLVRRSREQLEMEIEHFTVVERDGMIIGCAAIYPFIKEKVAELACLVVHTDYSDQGRGEQLLNYAVKQGKQLGIEQLFVLTTRTAHWFRERGFKAGELKNLPIKRQSLYNYQRQSKIFFKPI